MESQSELVAWRETGRAIVGRVMPRDTPITPSAVESVVQGYIGANHVLRARVAELEAQVKSMRAGGGK